MITLRCTQKLARRMTLTPGAEDHVPTNKLGDWYANTLNVGHERFVLCVSERSLLSLVFPRKSVRDLPSRLPAAVRSLLFRLGVPDDVIEEEVAAMLPIGVGLTRNRSTVGSLVELGREAQFLISPPFGLPANPDVELALASVPCLTLKPKPFPDLTAGILLGVQIANPCRRTTKSGPE
jgi:hypothetical protein